MSIQFRPCPVCDTENLATNSVCTACGAPLSATEAVPADLEPADRSRQQKVYIIYAITALFLVACIVLALLVIIWRP
jgi:hypothetical protein